MTTTAPEIFEKAGFKLVGTQYRADDPRGAEYGFYAVDVTSAGWLVSHSRDDYSMAFLSAESLINWSKAICL